MSDPESKEAEEAVLSMENARVDPSWGTVVRKLDVRDALRALRSGTEGRDR